MMRELGRFGLVWLSVVVAEGAMAGLWVFLPFLFAWALCLLLLQWPLLAATYGVALGFPKVSYRGAVAVLAVVLSTVLFALVATRLLLVPVVPAYVVYLVVARGPAPERDGDRVAVRCPACEGPVRMERVEAARIDTGEAFRLRAVYACTALGHGSWRWVDEEEPLRALTGPPV